MLSLIPFILLSSWVMTEAMSPASNCLLTSGRNPRYVSYQVARKGLLSITLQWLHFIYSRAMSIWSLPVSDELLLVFPNAFALPYHAVLATLSLIRFIKHIQIELVHIRYQIFFHCGVVSFFHTTTHVQPFMFFVFSLHTVLCVNNLLMFCINESQSDDSFFTLSWPQANFVK